MSTNSMRGAGGRGVAVMLAGIVTVCAHALPARSLDARIPPWQVPPFAAGSGATAGDPPPAASDEAQPANTATGDALAGTAAATSDPVDWPAYGRDPGGSRYSPADAITRENVHELATAWVYRTGHIGRRGGPGRFQATPIVVDGTLYVSSPFGHVAGLDPETGAERWRYDARVDRGGNYGDLANRGVSTWLDVAAPEGAPCRRRIYLATVDARLIALDAAAGRPCAGFGDRGSVDLTDGLRNAPRWRGEYQVTSPPAVLGDRIVVGSAIADNQRVDAPSGVVRAFDARTGRLHWSWDPIPRDPADPAHETWRDGSTQRTGAANAWSILAADPERDLVFVPTSSPSPDYYGGERLGQNLYANSVVALRGATGEVAWHFQVVRHDLWDYDVPAQPVLVTLRRDGEDLPALVQATKMGHLFVLHRETGEPLFPVEERPVPASTVPGEEAWPTQPFPVLPAPLVPQSLPPDEAFGLTPEDRAYCRDRIASLRSDGMFTPPSFEGTLVYPGNIGGSNWGGVSYDPVRGIVVAPSTRLAAAVRLVARADLGAARRSNPEAETAPQAGTPYGMQREFLLASSGVPCNPPPWGTLTAVELATGETLWERPLGNMPPLAMLPEAAAWGSPVLGGALITAGGLVFVAGTFDERLRAFDIETGEELWSAPLPAGGNATPMSYRTESGRQFVVIAAGGHDRMGTTAGDYVVAFALPEPGESRHGRTDGPDAAGDAAGRRHALLPLPILFYSPETGWAGGAALLHAFRGRADGRPTTTAGNLVFTQNGQVMAQLGADGYTGDGRWHVDGGAGHIKFPTLFHGIGNRTGPEDFERYTTQRSGIRVVASMQRWPAFYVGLGVEASATRILNPDAGGRLARGEVPGSGGGVVAGVRLALRYDDRDNVLNTGRGSYVDLSATGYGPAVGSDHAFAAAALDARRFLSLPGRSALAVQAVARATAGEAPFEWLPQLGGERLLRGHFQGRFRDRNLLAVQAEYRIPVFWRLGAAAFAGAGQVARRWREIGAGRFHVAAGGGLRLLLDEQEKLNLRVDLGFGRGESGVYFTVGEAI